MMKRFFESLARYFTGCGQPVSVADVAAEYRRNFERRIRPALVKQGWPIPVTDEGRSVCLDLMVNPFTRW
jgi:hypothetical protein